MTVSADFETSGWTITSGSFDRSFLTFGDKDADSSSASLVSRLRTIFSVRHRLNPPATSACQSARWNGAWASGLKTMSRAGLTTAWNNLFNATVRYAF